jgi:hypothetical protein
MPEGPAFFQTITRLTTVKWGGTRRAVIAENHLIVCILAVIAVIQWDQDVLYHHDCFVDFQQMTLLKAQMNSQVGPSWGQNFFGISLDIGITAPENGLLDSSQILG